MVIYGVKCVFEQPGGTDVYGTKLPGKRVQGKCAVVKLETSIMDSTVRVDSGATRGGAEEYRSAAVLLVPPKTKLKENDLIEMVDSGLKLRVTGIRLRYTVMGKLDHLQVECDIEQ